MSFRLKILTLGCLVAAGVLMAMAPPRPRAARAVRLTALPCMAGQPCQLVLSWTRPSNYTAATDTARVDWDQTAPGTFPDLRVSSPLEAADTFTITSNAAGKVKSGVVTLCHTRAGWTGAACNTPLTWRVQGEIPPTPPDTATSVQVSPASATLSPEESVEIRATVGPTS